MISEINKSFKTNSTSILTSIVCLLAICYYLFISIPMNKENLDTFNRESLKEFSNIFNTTLSDYSNTISPLTMKNIGKENLKVNDGNETETKKIYEIFNETASIDLINTENNFFTEGIIVQNIDIEAIKDSANQIFLDRKIQIKVDNSIQDKNRKPKYSTPEKELYLYDRISISKNELKKRLSGGSHFKKWCIMIADSNNTFLNQNIEKLELDTLYKKQSTKNGVNDFRFSDTRFYSLTTTIHGSDLNFVIIGGIDKQEFNNMAKKVPSEYLTLFVFVFVLIILLLPLLKSIASGKGESIGQFDLISTSVCIGLIALLFATFFLSNYLSRTNLDSINSDLTSINRKVRNELIAELNNYKREKIKVQNKLNSQEIGDIHINVNELLGKGRSKITENNLQNYFILNSKSELIRTVGTKSFLRKNISDRDYIKALKPSKFNNAFSAVYSKSDNKFKFVWIKKEAFVRGLFMIDGFDCFAYTPRFRDKLKFKEGSGFLLCNSTGNVLFNSDTVRNLTENLYLNSYKSAEILKLFRYEKNRNFKLTYNGKNTAFVATKLEDSFSNYPIYLISYKDLSFEDNLHMFAFINTFIIGLFYGLLLIFFAYLYSYLYNRNSIKLFSKSNFYWLFPDNSRRSEYNFLIILNAAACLLFFIFLFIPNKDSLFFTIINGINLIFINYFTLAQREYNFTFSSFLKAKTTYWFIFTLIVGSLIIPFILRHYNYSELGIFTAVLSHFVFLFYYKKYTMIKKTVYDEKNYHKPNVNFVFSKYITSLLCVIFLFIPLIFTLNSFNNQINKTKILFENDKIENNNVTPERNNEKFFETVSIMKAPSNDVMEMEELIDNRSYNSYISLTDYSNPFKSPKFLLFLLSIIAIIFIIYNFVLFFNKRYFLVDLAEAYRVNYFKNKNSFANFKVIIPPFNHIDLVNVEKYDRLIEDEHKSLIQNEWISKIPGKTLSPLNKINLINLDNFKNYKEKYLELWNSLSNEQKFVLGDFSNDHFVNYEYKKVLLELMELGFVIADPLNGRLKVMNYGFRDFVRKQLKNESDTVIESEKLAGNSKFSNYRVPVLIIGSAGLLLMVYLYKESFNEVMFIGGSLISAFGIISKFVDSYKK